MNRSFAGFAAAMLLCPPSSGRASPDDPPPVARAPRAQSSELPGGVRVPGRIEEDAVAGFKFVPATVAASIPLEKLSRVQFSGTGAPSASSAPPFHALMGFGGRLSGRLEGISAQELRMSLGADSKDSPIDRGGVVALVQRPGELQVFLDDFAKIDAAHWSLTGEPEIVDDPDHPGGKSLYLKTGGEGITRRLAEPIGAGRLELTYYDSGVKFPGHSWFLDLTFRGPNGLEPVQAVLGWDEDNLAVLSRSGPALAVQPLARQRGWHRLVARFGPDQTDLSVDGYELAHGDGPGGPLVEVRLASEVKPSAKFTADLAARIDELRLARYAQPSGRMEIDPTQDEARLVTGDQLFGSLVEGDGKHLTFLVGGTKADLSWADVSGVFFRRAPRAARPIRGLWTKIEWNVASAGDAVDRNVAEGALREASKGWFALEVPYAGIVRVPQDQVTSLTVLGRIERTVLDPTSHHLGNRIAEDLDPPQPEGPTLDLPFTIEKLPSAGTAVAIDVLQVIGESGNLDFSDRVRQGELRTRVLLNGKPFDDLNRHVTNRNETPLRIRLPIPAGLLRTGGNVLRFEQTGTKDDPSKLDNLGVLGIALESPATEATRGASKP